MLWFAPLFAPHVLLPAHARAGHFALPIRSGGWRRRSADMRKALGNSLSISTLYYSTLD